MDISKKRIIESPMNYVGGKRKLLPILIELFPKEIETFIDVCCGGCTVGINMVDKAERVICNDINENLIEMYKGMQREGVESSIKKVKEKIEKYGLKDLNNREGFMRMREDYDKGERGWEMYFTLVSHSFNSQGVVNKRGEFKSSYGGAKNYYNKGREGRMRVFVEKLKSIELENKSYKDIKIPEGVKVFVYIDPPYLITDSWYNRLYRWSEIDELEILKYCDELDRKGVLFGLSNVLEHKGSVNNILREWSSKYKVYELETNYSNAIYSRKKEDKEKRTKEVYITNYSK